MKSVFRKLFFDKTVVNEIKEVKLNEAQLYNLLYNGRITLREYLHSL